MKRRLILGTVCLGAGLLVSPVWAQQDAPAHQGGHYRTPLTAAAKNRAHAVHDVSATPSMLPVFAVEPTATERYSQDALVFLSRTAVAVASEKTGVYTPVPSPSYQPYRPGMSVPEPATLERSCPPLGTPNPSAACIER